MNSTTALVVMVVVIAPPAYTLAVYAVLTYVQNKEKDQEIADLKAMYFDVKGQEIRPRGPEDR